MIYASSIIDRESLNLIVINELKSFGVKYKDKKPQKENQLPSSQPCKKIFRQHLNNLDLTEVILFNGNAVQIPKIVADSCNRILEQVEVEGIFRKAGSAIRQKEIRTSLEAGLPVSKAHHVIDVANVLKYFFRELPEPLIPPAIQETLIRSLLIGENSLKAILLSCLLLTPLSLNTLSFFMQFLNTVSRNAALNKMNTQNLAIILTPGLMPFADINTLRFNNHVKLVQVLIENATLIGTVPECISGKMQSNNAHSPNMKLVHLAESVQKKKKRRSGSLTHMLSGFRKIVGAAIGSSEHLDSTPEKLSTCSDTNQDLHINPQVHRVTPCIKTNKKRRFVDPVTAFSAKKKKDLLALLPNHSGGFLPNTPLTKESKKNRMSLGGNRQMKSLKTNGPVSTSMERRWSIVGTGWPKSKIKNIPNVNSIENNASVFKKVLINKPTNLSEDECNDITVPTAEKLTNLYLRDLDQMKNQYQYNDIKERVEAIETRISQEFSKLRKSLNEHNKSLETSRNGLTGPERVKLQYEKVVETTDFLSSPGTDQLAKRLSRNLKIRPILENKVVRSPSARKIGSLRRRSAEKLRLSRNKTWHISSTSSQNLSNATQNENPFRIQHKIFYSGSNVLKKYEEVSTQSRKSTESIPNIAINATQLIDEEQWTSGEVFFKHSNIVNVPQIGEISTSDSELQSVDNFRTPNKVVYMGQNPFHDAKKEFTPMLPPKTIPRRGVARTPNSVAQTSLSAQKSNRGNNALLHSAIEEDANGRASIARLRSQNAGMVMAKAKLFDGMGNTHSSRTRHNCSSSSTEKKTVIPNGNDGRNKNFSQIKIDNTLDVNINTSKIIQHAPNNFSESLKPDTSSDTFQRRCTPKSPKYITKRQRNPLPKKQNLKNMQSIIKDESLVQCTKSYKNTLTQVRSLNNSYKSESPRTIKIRSHHYNGSPRRHVLHRKKINSPIGRNMSKVQNSKLISRSNY